MKYAFVIILAVLATDPFKIRKINNAKSEAKDAFQAGDYANAAQTYAYLIDSLGVKEDELILNRAHALYLMKDTANAMVNYQSLLQSPQEQIASKAGNQLGLILNRQGKPDEALSYFKQALRADPSNETARYNYEMLKKKLDQKKKQDQQKDQNKNDQQKKEPSEFAKRLKAQADRLVAERKYREAHELMMNGLQQDQTVSYYQQYIDRIGIVADINE